MPAGEQAVKPNVAVLRRNEVRGQEQNSMWKGYAENLLAVVLLKLHLTRGPSGELLGKSRLPILQLFQKCFRGNEVYSRVSRLCFSSENYT